MAYITKANLNRIIKKTDINEIINIFGKLEGEVYKSPIYFFNKWEVHELLIMQYILKDFKKFVYEIYKPVELEDTLRFVFESLQPPSYHTNKNCERLLSDYKNFPVPEEIRERALEKAKKERKNEIETENLIFDSVNNFRAWFKKYIDIFNSDPDEFLILLDRRWNIQRRIEEIELKNSGAEDFGDYSLNEIERKIDELLKESRRLYVKNNDKQDIIRRFQKRTFLAYKDEPIPDNTTGLLDSELKDFLKTYDETYKTPSKKLLREYYRKSFNPDLIFEGDLLKSLGFVQCRSCDKPPKNQY